MYMRRSSGSTDQKKCRFSIQKESLQRDARIFVGIEMPCPVIFPFLFVTSKFRRKKVGKLQVTDFRFLEHAAALICGLGSQPLKVPVFARVHVDIQFSRWWYDGAVARYCMQMSLKLSRVERSCLSSSLWKSLSILLLRLRSPFKYGKAPNRRNYHP